MYATASIATRKLSLPALAAIGLGLGLAAGAALVPSWATVAPGVEGVVVSQRDRSFNPGALSLRLDERLVVVNDDGSNVHHAYVEDEGFHFDSGDQEPGDRTVVAFPAGGTYQVLCGIHPKMRMTVTVR